MDNRVSIHNSSSNTPYTVFDSRRQPEADNNEQSSTSKLQKTVQSIVPGTLFNRLFMKDSTTRLHGSEVLPLNESSNQNRPTPQSAQGQSLDDRSSLKVPSLAAEILKDSRTKRSSQGSSARSSGEVSEIKGFHARLLRRKEGQVARRSSLSVASQASPGAQDYDSFSHQDCPPNGLDIFYPSSDNAVNMTGDSTIQPLNTHAMSHSSPAPGRSLSSGLQELQSSHEVEDSRLRQAHNFNSSSITARTKSSLMIEAFQEMEMEKSRLLSQVEQLQDRICQLEQENAATTLHSRETKENAVKAVRAATEKVEAMRLELESLKEQNIHSSLAKTMQQSIVEVTNLREIVNNSLKGFPSISSAGVQVDNAVTRATVQEIKEDARYLMTENSNKQQVLDMLRDQLDFYSGELAETKEQFMSVKEELRNAREALQKSNDAVISEGNRNSELVAELQSQHSQLINALNESLRLEHKLESTANELQRVTNMAQKDTLDYQAQISTLQTEMNGQREKLESQRRKGEDLHSQLAAAEESSRRLQEELVQCAALREETERLRRSEASLLAQIAVLNELKERTSAIPNLEVTLSVKEAEVERLNREIRSFKVLEQALSVKNGEMGELRKELDTANAKLNAVQMTSYDCARLEREIVDARKLLESEKEIRNRAIGEKEGCQKRLNEVEKELRAQLASAELKLQRSNTRFETLELQLTERDDASSALQSELKERLQTCESRLQLSNRDLLAATSHAALLEKTVQDLQKTLEIQLEEMQNMKDASEARLAELSATNELLFRAQNELESQTSALLRETAANEELKKQVEEARNMRSGIVKSMEETTVLSRMSQEELLEAQRTVSVLQRELSAIRGQLEQFQQRMSTLPTRCTNTSELNAEEAALVGKLMFVCRSFYEKELAEKGNSIRRRDNTIKEKDSHIKELEELLAKPQVPVVETCGTECSNSITTASVDPLTTLASLSQVNNDVPKDNTAPHSSTSQSNREASTTKPNRQPLLAALDRQSSQEQYLVPSSDDASRITLKTTCPSTVTAKKPDTSDKKRSKRSIDDSDYVDDEDVEVAQKRGKRGKMIESRRHSAQAEKAIAKQRTRRRH